ncbi:hypothetical protein [Duncaniella freteri]|uniref:hypothetical protein n=1 Tax=Duncaniella freteri TaxID=2530391 RepID=UPI003F66D937
MKKIPNRAKLPPPEPVVIKLDPKLHRGGIVLPKVKYEILATVETEEVFDGMVIPMPKVLIYFLSKNELMVVSTIMEEANENGECALSVQELAIKMRLSVPTLSNCLYSLRKIGLLLETPNGKRGGGRIRQLNYQAIQHLNDLVEEEDPGIYARIRKATRKINILNLTKDDVKSAYDTHVLEPGHDPAEEEEYN